MATVQYLALWLAAVAAAFLAGLATHYIHAHFQPYPDKIIDGHGVSDHLLNEALSPNYAFWGDYDEGGWWEFYSLRNFRTPGIGAATSERPEFTAMRPERASAVKDVCQSAFDIGLRPRLCG